LHDHARAPNETNLDTHYLIPPAGVWALAYGSSDPLIHPRASAAAAAPVSVPSTPSGPRQLIDNAPASKESFGELVTTPKPPAPPSSALGPVHASALVPRLRWANIGWSYHWGTKQYDFTRGKAVVDPRIQRVCKEAVRSVPWAEVFDGEGVGKEDDWGGESWVDWEQGYGEST
jgi:alkylated DNA repair protein alkB family protein 1